MVGLEIGGAVGGDDVIGVVDGVAALEAGCAAAAGGVGEAAGAWELAMTNKMHKQVET